MHDCHMSLLRVELLGVLLGRAVLRAIDNDACHFRPSQAVGLPNVNFLRHGPFVTRAILHPTLSTGLSKVTHGHECLDEWLAPGHAKR